MDNNVDEKPLTVKDVREVLIPAMEEVFATKKDLDLLRQDFSQFKHEILLSHDKILKDLFKIAVSSATMGLAIFVLREKIYWSIENTNTLIKALCLGGLLGTGILTYLACAFIFRSEQVITFLKWISRKK